MLSLISALLLIASGLAITLAGAYFSVMGITMLIPDPEIFAALIVLAVAFEAAKITASTFLFHEAKDRGYPIFFKLLLLFGILSLIAVSAISTFSHLNASVSKSMAEVKGVYAEVSRLEGERDRLQESLRSIDQQIASVPKGTGVYNRINFLKAYEKERKEKETALVAVQSRIDEASSETLKSDRFLFLNALSDLLRVDRERVFTIIIISLVLLIDPLAITLILAGSFLIEKFVRQRREASPSSPDQLPEASPQPDPALPGPKEACDCTDYHQHCHTADGCRWITERMVRPTSAVPEEITAPKPVSGVEPLAAENPENEVFIDVAAALDSPEPQDDAPAIERFLSDVNDPQVTARIVEEVQTTSGLSDDTIEDIARDTPDESRDRVMKKLILIKDYLNNERNARDASVEVQPGQDDRAEEAEQVRGHSSRV